MRRATKRRRDLTVRILLHNHGARCRLSPGRLSGFKRPKIAVPKRKRGLFRPVATKTVKAKGKGKGRNFGKLAQLMEMPLDVFFEVCILMLLRQQSHY
jgi:hypothetical protein